MKIDERFFKLLGIICTSLGICNIAQNVNIYMYVLGFFMIIWGGFLIAYN